MPGRAPTHTAMAATSSGVVPDHRRLTGAKASHNLLEAVIGDARRHRVVTDEQQGIPAHRVRRLLTVHRWLAFVVDNGGPNGRITSMSDPSPPTSPRVPKQK